MRSDRPTFWISTVLVVLLTTPSAFADERPWHHDPLPDLVQARIAARDALLAALLPPPEDLQFFADKTKTWDPGSVVRVAFDGGDATLRRQIAEVAAEWTAHAHLRLDFGDAPAYRSWSAADTEYQAEIRVTFAGTGYHSTIGTDATDPLVVGPGESSMTLAGFDVRRPATWKATVRHEFGHALGLLHEHQQPSAPCQRAFRWKDEPGYRLTLDDRHRAITDRSGRQPGIYTILGNAPWHWPEARADHNLRKKPVSDAFESGPFDRASIMRYWFPPWMFRDGAAALCTPRERNLVLSDKDKAGVATLYPRRRGLIRELLGERKRYYGLLTAIEALPARLRVAYGERLHRITEALDALDHG
ncbi:MAG: hypothetical protein AAGE94_21490 [Acidobacteriota bacterium]